MKMVAEQPWTNWSGSVTCTPTVTAFPRDADEVATVVGRARQAGRSLRPVGAGHSSSQVVGTDDDLVSLAALQDVTDVGAGHCEATIGAGVTLHDAGTKLFEHGMAFHNLGDIDKQTVVGAVMTGTHGTGPSLPDLSSILVGGRLVTADGEVRDLSMEQDRELVEALRVSLGTLGILTHIRIRLVSAYRLRRREWCAGVEDCLAHLDELVSSNRNMDFYWYPRRDEVKIRTMNLEGDAIDDLPYATAVEDETNWSHRIIAQQRELRFEEMEYALPAAAGPACFREIRDRVKAKHRQSVGWRLLYRTVAPDEAWLSPAFQRETVTISLHQNASLPFWEYFTDIEPIFRHYGGRPHWGKKHTLRAPDLRPLYPQWDRFQSMRRRLDPDGVFLTPALRGLLEAEEGSQ